MFKNTFQSGFLSILYSIGSKPLQIWDKQVRNGHIKRITDQDIQSSVLEIMGTNVSTNHITCPADKNKTLGIKLPFLVMIIKNVSVSSSHHVQSAPVSLRVWVWYHGPGEIVELKSMESGQLGGGRKGGKGRAVRTGTGGGCS
jgi:hypothetical protein